MIYQMNSKTECAPDCVCVLGHFEFLLDSNILDVQDENQGSSTVFRTWTAIDACDRTSNKFDVGTIKKYVKDEIVVETCDFYLRIDTLEKTEHAVIPSGKNTAPKKRTMLLQF